MEFYWAYADYRDGMELVKKMYRKIAKEVLGKAISLSDHEALIEDALEKAKKEGVFKS